MKQRSTGHALDADPKLSETEFALDISPCPRIEGSEASASVGGSANRAGEREEPGHRRSTQGLRRSVLDDDDLMDTLTAGWAIALAIAVAVVISVSGV